ncbi:MAG: cls1 [Myxococcales bacterium]|nr:cls1 [Myxococcales bacterium]
MTRTRFAALLPLFVAGCAVSSPHFELVGPVPPPSEREAFAAALFQTTDARLTGGHRWQLEDSGKIFTAIVAAIGQAEHSINLESYIWHSGEPSNEIVAALSNRARGVACRIVVDPLGSPDFESNVKPQLDAMGCESHFFRPMAQHPIAERNHRKIVVIDGRIGFVGGFGVRQEWVKSSGSSDPEWRDINLRIEGPVVHELQRAFAQNWQEAGGALLPASDFPSLASGGAGGGAGAEGEPRAAFVASSYSYVTNAQRLVLLAVASAHKRLWIWNAYFVPDAVLRDLLLRKRREGVDVRILVPGDKNDVTASKLGQRNSYPPLLAAGIRIFEYQPSMMHAKTMIVDDRVSLIGSINLDVLSLRRLEEDSVIVDDPALVDALERDWVQDVAHCREVH